MSKPKSKGPARKAVVTINREWCKGCGICISFCPKGALTWDGDKASWSRPENCIGCGACELRCPDMAVEVIQDEGGPEAENHG